MERGDAQLYRSGGETKLAVIQQGELTCVMVFDFASAGPVNVETRNEERFQKEVGVFLPGGGLVGTQGVTLDDIPVEEVVEVR